MMLRPIGSPEDVLVIPEPAGREQLTVSTTVLRLDPPDLATEALMQVQDQPVRWRVDGADPSTTSGWAANADDVYRLIGWDTMRAFRVVREGGTDAVLEVVYFTTGR